MADQIRAKESATAARLQAVLGPEYVIEYDSGESGLTRCYHNRKLYKEVPNSAMSERINVYEYTFNHNNH